LFETVSACMAKHGFHTCDNGSLGSPTTMRRVVADAVDALVRIELAGAGSDVSGRSGTPYAQCWMPKSGRRVAHHVRRAVLHRRRDDAALTARSPSRSRCAGGKVRWVRRARRER
jgi:hypothetical protein